MKGNANVIKKLNELQMGLENYLTNQTLEAK